MRDVVRCRETFQREILKSRHYILKFLARRGFVFRDGHELVHAAPASGSQHLTTERSPLAPHDRLVYREYHALLHVQAAAARRARSTDRTARAILPSLAPMVATAAVLSRDLAATRRWCSRRRSSIGAASNGRRSSRAISGSCRARTRAAIASDSGSITKAGNSHCRHVLVQAAWSYRHRPADERRSQTPTAGPTAGGDHARVEGAAAAASAVQSPRVSEAAADRGGRGRARARRLSVGVMQDLGVAGGVDGERSIGRGPACGSRLDVRALSMALCGPCRMTAGRESPSLE